MAATNPASRPARIRNKPSETVPYESAGPEQLAAQPAKTNIVPLNRDPEWIAIQGHLQARLASMRMYRYSWAIHWQLLETYLLPRRGIFINVSQATPNQMTRGSPINQAILNGTGTQAMRICAAGMMGGLMSPGRPWFKLKPSMMDREELGSEVEMWFEEVEDRMYHVMARSNFYDSGAQMFEDLVTFGTAPVIIYEDLKDIIRCYNPCPGEYYAASSSAFRVEFLYRLFNMTIAQIVGMFGLENCNADVQQMWRTKGAALEQERLVAHAIEPNFPIEAIGRDSAVVPGGFPYREVFWMWGASNTKPLSMRGFRDPPFICPRWAVTSNDPYGRSAGMDALPDIMQLQVETARKAEAIEKMVRPPMLASMAMKNEPSSILPGHLTYVPSLSDNEGMRPAFTVKPMIGEMMQDLKEIEERIERGFFKDIFLLQTDTTKEQTAYEVAQKQQEKLQVLGPIVERFQNEAASPAIKRIFRIMERKGLLPPLPAELRGVSLSIEYVSLMALAQRAASTAAMERFAQVAGNLGAVYPEAKFSLNPLNFMREYADQLGVSKRVQNTEAQVKAAMKQLEDAQKQQQMMQQGLAISEAAKNLAGIDVGGGINAAQLGAGGGAGLGG